MSSAFVILSPGDESGATCFQADVRSGLCSVCSEFRQSPENKMVAPPARGLLVVYDELIISEMSFVMKIGHLQEATQSTVTEVFTFPVTPSSSPSYTPLPRDGELRAEPPTLRAYEDYSCSVSRVPISSLAGRNAFGSVEGSTNRQHS